MSWEAVDLALALHAAPRDLAMLRARALPDGVDRVLRLALGQDQVIAEAAAATGHDRVALVEAARFFIEQMLLARECEHDPWRVLGLAPGSNIARIREHQALLTRLVHPDRSDEWASVYADRVSKAWRVLRHQGGEATPTPALAPPEVDEDFGDGEPPPPPRTSAVEPDAWQPAAAVAQRPRFEAPPHPVAAPAAPGRTLALSAGVLLALAATFWLGQRSAVRAPIETEATASSAAAPAVEATSEAQPRIDAPSVAATSAAESSESVQAPPVLPSSVLPEVAAQPVPPAPAQAPTAATPPANTDTKAATAAPNAKPRSRLVTPALASVERPQRPERIAQPSAAAADQGEPAPPAAPALAELFPPPIAAPAAVAVPASGAPTRDETLALLDRYTQSYTRGDLDGVLALFAREVHNDPRSVASIAGEYSRLFDSTRDREIRLHDLRWRSVGDRVAGEARYEASYQRNGRSRRQTVQGRLAFELVHDAGQSRLVRLVSRDDGGS
jgi:hypothetical protein